MKKFFCIIIALLTLFFTAGAQNITGKWKCSKDFLNSLGTAYVEMRGYYKFKKDSKFSIKIHGRGLRFGRGYKNISKHRTIYINVKGTYSIAGNTITTTVKPEDVSCYIDTGLNAPEMPTAYEADRRAMAEYNWKNNTYEQGKSQAHFQEETVKNELMYVWNWTCEPVTVTKKTLTIGDKVTFGR